MLCNRAIPREYGKFRESVLRGEIAVNLEISQQMSRVDFLIDSPDYYYDDQAIDGFIRFCENEMTLTNGDPLHLLDSFKLWAEDVLAWYHFPIIKYYCKVRRRFVEEPVKRRLRLKQYLIVARGGAKSMYASLLQAYFLIIDTESTHQIVTAPTMKQSEETMQPIRIAMTKSRGPLFKFLTQGSIQNTTGSRALRPKLASTKKGIQNFLTDSILEIRPMSIDKLQGLRSKVNTIDEWLSGKVMEDPIGAIEQGASKLNDYFILATSSEGTVRDGVGDEIKIELARILRREIEAHHVSIWHYKLDKIEEVANEDMWVKAQPNIGMTVSYDAYQRDVERAESEPATRNDILAKRFGIPVEGYTYFFTYEETLPTVIFSRYRFKGMECYMGADMSQGDDFCAFNFLFELRDGRFGTKARSYVSQIKYDKLPEVLRRKYDEFVKEGTLRIMPGAILNMMDVYDDLDLFIQHHEYIVVGLGYDPYNADAFVNRWKLENSPFGVHKVIQGARTESVPLGEIKILAREGMLIFDEEIMKFAMGNSVVIEDTNGNRKLSKRRSEEKIDNVSALMDAKVAYNRDQEGYFHEHP